MKLGRGSVSTRGCPGVGCGKGLATGAVFRIAVTVGALGVGAVCGALANLLMPDTFATLHGHTGLTAIQLGALGFWAASIFREVPSLDEVRRTVRRHNIG